MKDLRNNMTRGERRDRTKTQSFMFDRRFCTFRLAEGKGRGTGILEDDDLTGKKTIRVSVVSFGERSQVSGQLKMTVTGTNVKRHIRKHNMKFFKPGIIPVNGY